MIQPNLPQPVAGQFADYVETHKNDILTRWSKQVADDARIPSTDAVDMKELWDHLPLVLDELCFFLRQSKSPETSDELAQGSEIHGGLRWLQGFSLAEVMLEIERLRKVIFIDLLGEFAASQPGVDVNSLRQIEHSAYDFFRELTVGSILRYTDSNDEKLRADSEDLAQSNEQLDTLNTQLRAREARIQELSLTDPLTEIANRRHLDTRLVEEITRSRRYGEPLSLVILDLDFFKAVNDQFGHPVGDSVLKSVASLIKAQCRETDFVARLGGEEFILILPSTTLDDAKPFVSRMCVAMSKRLVPPLEKAVTGSFGVAQFNGEETGAILLARADKAMYRAKSAGRNCFRTDP